jgi:hypothetical protein
MCYNDFDGEMRKQDEPAQRILLWASLGFAVFVLIGCAAIAVWLIMEAP